MTMNPIKTGQHIGRYEVVGFLGRGAFAQVFAAEDERGRRVALKMGAESGGGRFLERFSEVTSERQPERISPDETPAEAMFLNSTDGAHPELLDAHEVDQLLLGEANKLRASEGEGVVALREVIQEEGRPILVLEHLEGTTLRQRIRSLEGVKLGWLADAACIVEHHVSTGHWDCHGDLKPENLFIGKDGQVRLLDPIPASNREDALVSTPHYNPFLDHSPKGDCQALAIMLYELLAGALPFETVPFRYAGVAFQSVSKSEIDLERSFFLGYPQARELNPRAPRELEQLIFRSLCDENFGLTDFRRGLEDFLLRR